jgi:hypothetical protein
VAEPSSRLHSTSDTPSVDANDTRGGAVATTAATPGGAVLALGMACTALPATKAQVAAISTIQKNRTARR